MNGHIGSYEQEVERPKNIKGIRVRESNHLAKILKMQFCGSFICSPNDCKIVEERNENSFRKVTEKYCQVIGYVI